MIVGIIPARGGSKRILNKNISNLNGKPLIYYTIMAALKSRIDEVYVSTDSRDIAYTSKFYGVEVIYRPDFLATDEALLEPVICHAVTEIEKISERPNIIVTLQPTSPFRKAVHINKAIDILCNTSCDSVIGVTPHIKYYFSGRIDECGRFKADFDLTNRLRTQDITPKYYDNGSIYVMTRNQIMEGGCRIGQDTRVVIMKDVESIDIDNTYDLKVCEMIMNGDIIV